MPILEDILTPSLEACQERCKCSPEEFDKLVVGAAVLSRGPTEQSPRVLLVQRSAEEKFYPNQFEIPGGKLKSVKDKTMFEAIRRELLEETSLE
ncbi:MAG: hypothetical protein M1831_002153 [Alyxoria varia]|nr:MAG: hypothetical protein M1831_002153 [Alyxoria varia]